MKNILIFIIVTLMATSLYGQRDTIVILTEKNADFITYEETVRITDDFEDYEKEFHNQFIFTIKIKCHYYDGKHFDWFARILLMQMKNGFRNWDIDNYKITINKDSISNYRVITADSIHKIKKEKEIKELIGLSPSKEKVIYHIFKRDFNKKNIILYRVAPYVWQAS